MAICSQCYANNAEGTVFCTSCGNKMQPEAVQGNTTPIQDNIDATNVQPTAFAPINPEMNEKPKKKNTLPVIIALVLVLLVAGYFAVSALSNSNPSLRLLKGFAEMAKMDVATLEISGTVENDGDLEDLLKKVAFKAVFAIDSNKMLGEGSIDLQYDKKDVVSIMAGVNSDIAYIDPKDLYEEDFLYQLPSDYTDNMEPLKIVRESLKGIKLDIDYKKYAKIMAEELDENIEKKGGDIVLTVDAESMNSTMKAIVEEAKDDKKLMESVRKSAETVLKDLIKQSDKLEDMMDVEELETTLEQIQDKNEFEDVYAELLDEMLDSLDYAIDEVSGESTLTFSFGVGSKIKSVRFESEIEDEYSGETTKVNVLTSISNGAKFSGIKEKSAIDLEEITSDYEEMQKILEDVAGNLVKKIKANKNLVKDLDKTLGMDVDDLEDTLMSQFGF